MLDSAFGRQVRAARRAKNITQFELGQRIARSTGYVSKVELAQTVVPPEVRKKLVRVLNLSNGGRR
jgi:transcriptional regulator with XRE-family HTH domain